MATEPNLLLVTKGHPFEKGPFFDLFDRIGMPYTHVEQPAARLFLDPNLADDYDALVFYDMPGITFAPGGPVFETPSPALREGFLNLLAAGKGMVFLHHALAGWPAWEEYAEIVGGRFLYVRGELRGEARQDSGYRHAVTHEITIAKDHPVTRGLPPAFTMTDELYLGEVFEESIEPLLTSNYTFEAGNFYSAAKVVKEGKMFDNEGWAHPTGSNIVGWVKHYLASPIVYLQGGDDPVAWESEYYQQLLDNAIRWAASGEALAWATARRASTNT